MQAHGMVAHCLAFYFIMIGFDRQARLAVDREKGFVDADGHGSEIGFVIDR
jgi:hypothetical protein